LGPDLSVRALGTAAQATIGWRSGSPLGTGAPAALPCRCVLRHTDVSGAYRLL